MFYFIFFIIIGYNIGLLFFNKLLLKLSKGYNGFGILLLLYLLGKLMYV